MYVMFINKSPAGILPFGAGVLQEKGKKTLSKTKYTQLK